MGLVWERGVLQGGLIRADCCITLQGGASERETLIIEFRPKALFVIEIHEIWAHLMKIH